MKGNQSENSFKEFAPTNEDIKIPFRFPCFGKMFPKIRENVSKNLASTGAEILLEFYIN